MTHSNPQGDFVQFILGGALASGGAYALMNQVFLGSGFRSPSRYLYGSYTLPFGTPGMGLLMIPLGIGVVMLFSGWLPASQSGLDLGISIGAVGGCAQQPADAHDNNHPLATGG